MTARMRDQLASQRRWPDRVLSLATLSAVAYSMCLFYENIVLKDEARRAFVGQNRLGVENRNHLLLALAISAVIPPLVVGALAVFARWRVDAPLQRWAKILAPLGVAFLLPPLFMWQYAQPNTLIYFGLLTIMVVSLRVLLARSFGAMKELSAPEWIRNSESLQTVFRLFRKWRVPRWVYLVVVLLGASAYAAYTGYWTVIHHRQIQTSAFDLGIYDNLMYNALTGHPFYSPVLFGPGDPRSYVAGHAEYAMMLFVPFYALRPGPETLLIIQSVVLGFAAVPLYLLASVYASRFVAVLIAFSYLMFAPLHGPHFYDFHWLPLGIFFHFWLFYAIARKKIWWTLLALLATLAVREDVAVGIAFLGLFLFVTGARVRLGASMALLSAAWFGVNKFILMPMGGSWWFENMYHGLFADGVSSYASLFKTLLTNPAYTLASILTDDKLFYILHMLVPLAFLPVQRLAFVLLFIPGAVFTVLLTGKTPMINIAFQYTAHWIPYLFLTSILGIWLLSRQERGRARSLAAVGALVVGVLSQSFNFGAILQTESFHGGFLHIDFSWTKEMQKRYADLLSVTRLIPRTASVAATEYMVPHVSTRKDIYTFRQDLSDVDYIMVSSHELTGENRRRLEKRVQKTRYGLVRNAGEFYLFKKGDHSKDTAAAFRRLRIHSAL